MPRIGLSPMVIFCNADTFIFFPAMPFGSASEAEQVRESLETRNMPAGEP